MPLWNLTEEKVNDLLRLLEEKKKDYRNLEATPISELWNTDLDRFLVSLEDYEEKEEKDRMAHGGMKNEGKKKRKV